MTVPLPSNMSFGTVRGRFGTSTLLADDADGFPDFVPLSGLTITFTASVDALLNRLATPDPVTIVMEPIVCTIDPATGYLLGPDGEQGVKLIATDDVDVDPHGDWTYNVTYGSITAAKKLKAHVLTVPTGSERWITNISPVPSSTGVSLSQAQAAQDAATLAASEALASRAGAEVARTGAETALAGAAAVLVGKVSKGAQVTNVADHAGFRTALTVAAASSSSTLYVPDRRIVPWEGTVNMGLSGTPQAQTLYSLPATGFSLVGRAGPGRASIAVDPATVPTAGMLMIQCSTAMLAGAGYAFRDLDLVGNEHLLGDGITHSVWGIGNRRDSPAASVDDLVVENSRFFDFACGITSARRNPTASLGDNRDKRWRIVNNDFTTCSNRMIELSQCLYPVVAHNRFWDCVSSLHLVGYTEWATVTDHVAYNCIEDGIRLNYGVQHNRFRGGYLAFKAGVASGRGALQYMHEPVSSGAPTTWVGTDNEFVDYYFGCPDTGTQRYSLAVHLDTGCIAQYWDNQRFVNCNFAGDIEVVPFFRKPACGLTNWKFTGGSIGGQVHTVSTAEYDVRDWVFRGVHFTSATSSHVIRTNNFTYIDCIFESDVIIADTATGTIMKDCVVKGGALTDLGINSSLEGNIVFPSPAVAGRTIWDADNAALGTGTNLATLPVNVGSALTAVSFVPRLAGQEPTVLASAVAGHKALVFSHATLQAVHTSAFGSAEAQPFAVTIAFNRAAVNMSHISYLWTGGANAEAQGTMGTTGKLNAYGLAGGTATVSTATPANDAWHVAMFVFDGTTVSMYVDKSTVADKTGTIPAAIPMTLLRLSESGSGGLAGTTNYGGMIQAIELLDHVPTGTERRVIMSERAAAVGIILGS